MKGKDTNASSAKKTVEIVQKGNPILRKKSSLLLPEEIKSPKIKAIIVKMKKTMDEQLDAVAIAAVQIGEPIALFIISKRAFVIQAENNHAKSADSAAGHEKSADLVAGKKDMVFINPKITKTSKTKQTLEEGCLSVRYFYGQVLRSEKATVEGLDENGKKISRGFSGLLAQIVQHETDHINGALFIDKAKDLVEVSHEEYEKSLKEMSN